MRTFVAIEIPEPLKLNLNRSVEELRSGLKDGLIRWVRLEDSWLMTYLLKLIFCAARLLAKAG